ncbi:MAG: site-specific integrase [Alphaproteobacteria bacterium]|nr:site-specific integrase [Alphaproteobacteria bacterium]
MFALRVYFFDQNGKRRLKQHSLGTKDSAQARVLALRFNLHFEEAQCDMERKKTVFEELADKVSNPLKITIGANVLDFDPSNPAEVAYVEKLRAEQAAYDKCGAEKVLAQLWTPDQAQPQARQRQKGKPFSEATEIYLVEKTLDNKQTTIDEKRRTYKDFVAIYGDLDINQITKAEMVAWKSREIKRDLSANRINKRLGQVNDFFNWAIKHGEYTASDQSPCEGLFVSKKAKLAKATENREPFTNDDVKAIFGNGYHERFFAPDHYWIPLVCLFSGARREEVGDLLSANVKTVDGVPTFLVEEGKTKDARRTVPVHQTLIELGFMDYAKARQEAGHANLFPHRPKGAGGRSKEAGRMFRLRLRTDCQITNTRKTLHSLRHTVITRLHTADANPAHVKQITGHSSEARGVHFQTYTHDIGLTQLAETLNRLAYPHDFASLRLADPTFKAFFAKEKTADEKQAERDAKNAQHLKAKAEREERNKDKRKKDNKQ